jgi:1-acyl-sn-glycerol-3-phosphate acyltransferase
MLRRMQAELGRAILKASGWHIEGGAPNAKKFVLIAAPHTSNWDFVYAISCTSVLGLPLQFMAKDALFRGPLGALLGALGGIAIDRSKANNVVDAMVREFATREALALLVPPEGTRKEARFWKSGFYHIARRAEVPVALGFLDYARKRVGIGPLLSLSGNVHADMEQIRAFYADKVGKHPARFTAPRLREEKTSSPVS